VLPKPFDLDALLEKVGMTVAFSSVNVCRKESGVLESFGQ
jgi:hypothetical protein